MKLGWEIVCTIGLLIFLGLGMNVVGQPKPQPKLKTRNVVLIVSDGLRWQEVFKGPDKLLMGQEHGGVENIDALRRDFWQASPLRSRQMLFPFMWKTVAHQGQIFGNQEKESIARMANGLAFSYPGYNEMLTGFPDPHIDKNDFGPNPNVTILKWLNRMPEFRGRVAVLGTRDIFNQKRSSLFISAGWDPIARAESHSKRALLNDFYSTTTRLWDDNVYDAFLQPLGSNMCRRTSPKYFSSGTVKLMSGLTWDVTTWC